jgi:hypothetical protein
MDNSGFALVGIPCGLLLIVGTVAVLFLIA